MQYSVLTLFAILTLTIWTGFVASELEISDALDRLGSNGWWPDDCALQEACGKFARIIREHAQLLQTLV